MDSKLNTFKSGTSYTNSRKQGFSLKKRLLKKWIYANHYTQIYVANALNISIDEFKRKLLQREKFSKEQIYYLVHLLGAKAAFKVIFFPTFAERQRVYRETFGR